MRSFLKTASATSICLFLLLSFFAGACLAAGGAGKTGDGAEWGFFAIINVGDPLKGLSHVGWSRVTGMYWQKLEEPPGSGRYNWDMMDEYVQKAQGGGYDLVFVLKTGNDRKTSDPACYGEAAKSRSEEKYLHSCPTRKDFAAAWKKLVSAVIERYDGDGRADMPGLKKSFRLDVQIENEAGNPNFWFLNEKADGRKAARAYLELLRLSCEARDEADPGTKIILAGLIDPNYLARCEGSPRPEKCSSEYVRRNREFTVEVLRHPDYFDAVDVHFFNYFRYDPGYVKDGVGWVRRQMAANGYDKPIYSLEWTGAMMMDLKKEKRLKEFLRDFPQRKDFRDNKSIEKMYKELSAKKNSRYRAWFESEEAVEFAKMFSSLLANGVKRLIHVQFHDYFGRGWNNIWWNWHGVVKYEGTFERPVMIKKPSYYTYNLLSDRLYGFSSARVLDYGKGVFAYEFSFAGGNPVYVVWTEGDETKLDLSRHMGKKQAKVMHIVKDLDARNEPVRVPEEAVPAAAVPVSSEPVLVE